jgi:hypothetical protein
VEYLLASFWLVWILVALGMPERLREAIRGRLERTEKVQQGPLP